MSTQAPIEGVAHQITAHVMWHAWVMEYGITHHRMLLALHQGNFPRTATIELLDCVHFGGDLQGGPYSLTLAKVDYRGESLWEIRSLDGSFRVVFADARVVKALAA